MKIYSMTGYGRGKAQGKGVTVLTELRSVNRKQFEARLDLPDLLQPLEKQMRNCIHAKITRGAIDCRVKMNAASGSGHKQMKIDDALAASCVRRLRKLAGDLGLKNDLSLDTLLTIPGIVLYEQSAGESEKIFALAMQSLRAALRSLQTMRAVEGGALTRDIVKRFKILEKTLKSIARRVPAVQESYKLKLKKRIRELGFDRATGDSRLLREMSLFADRSDIAEEATRLRSHLKQAFSYLDKGGVVGRTLDFLLQEMFREINTIGAKANDALISGLVVGFKTELERVREQIQNIE